MDKCVFNKDDYNSPDGMLTSVWGPNMWHFLHTMSFNYPINPTEFEKKHYLHFIKSLQYVLPCKYCRDNLKKNLKVLKLTKSVMKNRDTFSRWLYKLHNHVNKMLGKNNTVSYNEVRDRYEHFRARCVTKKISKQNGGTKKNKIKTQKRNQKGRGNKEKGCTKPLYGVKSMSVINIVPRRKGIKTLKISPKCMLKKSMK
tara:strand:+ start:985 stop:1581 length:597 start_codon:yes stop_codon:yes gene_type:complete